MATDGIIAKILGIFGNEGLVPVVLFALFILIAYYVFQVMQDVMIIIIISVGFPFMANAVLGTHFGTDIWALILFATIGVGLYFVYLLLSWLSKGSKLLMLVFGIIVLPVSAVLSVLKRIIFGSGGKKKKDDGGNGKKSGKP